MSWRDRLLPASFRLVKFHVEGSELATGRRVVTHEYPLRDEPQHEDLGARTNEIWVEGYVLGDDYLERLDTLLAALRKPGPGELIHPIHGAFNATVVDLRVRHEQRDAGIAHLTITFQGSRSREIRRRLSNTRAARTAAVETAADRTEAAAADEFASSLEGEPSSLAQEAVANQVSGLAAVIAVIGYSGEAGAGASYLRRAQNLADSVLDQIENPGGLANEIQSLIRDLTGGVTSRLAAFEAYRPLIGLQGNRPRGSSAQAAAARATAQATETLIRSTATTQQARAAIGVRWKSREDAVRARDEVQSALDAIAESASDAVFVELRALFAVVSAAIPGAEGDYPRLESIVLDETLPSLVVSQMLYGTADREAELLERNEVRHPGFVPGGRALEVLARDG